jgi:pSer/pThr/pTyr-binding forkhead associated (FHA) protein
VSNNEELWFARMTPDGFAPLEPVELKNRLTIGRDSSCDLTADDSFISKFHASITHVLNEDGKWMTAVRDDGSTNGVFVNDRKVIIAPLRSGDVIRCGKTEWVMTSKKVDPS